jgi:addiction module HigA family antidote
MNSDAVTPAGVPIRHPTHPGRFLERHFLRPLALTQTRAALLLGVSRRRVNELTLGQRAMSADTAIRCAIAFGVRADFWLALPARSACAESRRSASHNP